MPVASFASFHADTIRLLLRVCHSTSAKAPQFGVRYQIDCHVVLTKSQRKSIMDILIVDREGKELVHWCFPHIGWYIPLLGTKSYFVTHFSAVHDSFGFVVWVRCSFSAREIC